MPTSKLPRRYGKSDKRDANEGFDLRSNATPRLPAEPHYPMREPLRLPPSFPRNESSISLFTAASAGPQLKHGAWKTEAITVYVCVYVCVYMYIKEKKKTRASLYIEDV